MESMLIGSFQKPSFPFPFAPQLCSFPGGNALKCKSFSNVETVYAIPEKLCVRRQNLMQQHVKNIGRRRITINPKGDLKYVVNAASGHSLESEPSKSPWGPVQQAFDAFYRFSRPHTVIGTALSIISVSLLAVEKLSDFSPLFFAGLFEAIVAALLMNIYIVGLNQISDIEIDKTLVKFRMVTALRLEKLLEVFWYRHRLNENCLCLMAAEALKCSLRVAALLSPAVTVNKPYLPLASGEYSVKTGVMIVSSFGILSFCLGWIVGSWPLFWALFISFMLGTAYSIDVPLLRWKRFAVVAAMCIFAVRAVIVQVAFYLHIQTHVFGRPGILTKPVIFATAFMSFFSVVIALFKDIPDIVGDKIYGIQSFTVRMGQERVFWICITLLEMAYAVALFVGATSSCTWSKWATVIGHSMLGYLLWNRAKSIDFKSKAAITSFYMFVWKLFYAEYLLIPLVR